MEIFTRIFEYLDIPWSRRTEKNIVAMTSGENQAEARSKRVQDFHRDSGELFKLRKSMLSLDERLTIWGITKKIASLYYDQSSFDLQ